jgi:general secretion pathway protein L
MNEINLSATNFLEKMSEWAITQPAINLLQGPYQSRQKTLLAKKIWLGVAGITITWILLAFLNNVVSLIILQQATHQSEQAINAIYKEHFPEATAMVAPRERMEGKLKKIISQVNQNEILFLLSNLGHSTNEVSNIHIQTLDFRDHRLNLTVLSASFDSLDNFTQSLKKQGLTVKQQSATMVETQVKANLTINKGVS